MRRAVDEYKVASGCVDCGERDPRCLDLDHRPGAGKVGCVGVMISETRRWKTILEELHKCDVRCANCHRKRTRERGTDGWNTRVVIKPERIQIDMFKK
jgi:hypothetical protein